MTLTHLPPKPRLEFQYVTIGVLTALEEEYSACLKVFDPEREGVEKEEQATSGTLTCWLCSIPAKHGGTHVVAITRLPHMGNTAAAIAANILLQHCEAIKSLIMCGIAGAVPNSSKPENHVRLGDIVVSNQYGIIQYDFGKQRDPLRDIGHLFNGFEFRAPPRPPCPRLMAAVGRMHSEERLLGRNELRDWEKKIDSFLLCVGDAASWKRPGPSKDKLIDTPNGIGTATRHPTDPARRSKSKRPRVFQGAIGAANVVLADPKKRDALRDRWDIRAVEMEGSGVADASWVANIGYLVVRGTCDYCNSTKNDDWHSYAALIAAAYARSVIEYLHAVRQPENFPAVQEIVDTADSTSLDAPPVPPKIDASKLSGDSSRPSVEQGRESSPMKHQTSPTVFLAPAVSGSVAVPPELDYASTVVLEPQSLSPEHRHIQGLNERIEALLESGRLKEAGSLIVELEKLLGLVARRGAMVREGWLLVARIEAARLRMEKKPGEKPDVGRLRRLREEAESVVD